MKTATRAAIIIGAPGLGKDFLHGVNNDIKHFTKYLQSDQGGHWHSDEIRVRNGDALLSLAQLQKVRVDYSVVYFSGHGFVNELGEQMLVIENKAVNVRSLINHSPRQLIIVDACRTYAGARISGPTIPSSYDSFDGISAARQLLDHYILNSPPGITIVYATQFGTVAMDHPVGGYFTSTLLNAALAVYTQQRYCPLTIEGLMRDVGIRLQRLGNKQVPEVRQVTGNLQVPFSLGFAHQETVSIQYKTKQSANDFEWIGAAGLLILFIGALAASK